MIEQKSHEPFWIMLGSSPALYEPKMGVNADVVQITPQY